MKHHSLEAERGFTLIEAVVAALLFALALLGLAQLQGTMTLFASDSRMRTQALNLAQQKMEDLRQFSHQSDYYALPCDGSDTPSGTNTSFNRTWTLNPCPHPPDTTNEAPYKQANVTVKWTDPKGQEQTVQLTSYISRNDPVREGVTLIASGGGGGGGGSSSSSSSSDSSSSSSTSGSSSTIDGSTATTAATTPTTATPPTTTVVTTTTICTTTITAKPKQGNDTVTCATCSACVPGTGSRYTCTSTASSGTTISLVSNGVSKTTTANCSSQSVDF